jgi:hypothetical protein
MAGDWTMLRLSQALRRRGYATARARIGINVGCTSELVDRLELRLEALLAEHGRNAAVVGWSRGGILGRLVAVRRPDLVAALITLGSPSVNPLGVNRMVELQIRLLSRLRSVGVPHVLGSDCLTGACADEMGRLLRSRFPQRIPYISFYSKTDGVVAWEACCDPDAELVEVKATHLQMGSHPAVIRMIVARLDELARPVVAAAS